MLFFSSVVTVPLGDSVTVFSLEVTVPLLLTLVVFWWDTSWAHPTRRNDSAKVDAAVKMATRKLFMVFLVSNMAGFTAAVKVRDRLALTMGKNPTRWGDLVPVRHAILASELRKDEG